MGSVEEHFTEMDDQEMSIRVLKVTIILLVVDHFDLDWGLWIEVGVDSVDSIVRYYK